MWNSGCLRHDALLSRGLGGTGIPPNPSTSGLDYVLELRRAAATAARAQLCGTRGVTAPRSRARSSSANGTAARHGTGWDGPPANSLPSVRLASRRKNHKSRLDSTPKTLNQKYNFRYNFRYFTRMKYCFPFLFFISSSTFICSVFCSELLVLFLFVLFYRAGLFVLLVSF